MIHPCSWIKADAWCVNVVYFRSLVLQIWMGLSLGCLSGHSLINLWSTWKSFPTGRSLPLKAQMDSCWLKILQLPTTVSDWRSYQGGSIGLTDPVSTIRTKVNLLGSTTQETTLVDQWVHFAELSSLKPPLDLCLLEVIGEGLNRHKGWSWWGLQLQQLRLSAAPLCVLVLVFLQRVGSWRLEIVEVEPDSEQEET